MNIQPIGDRIIVEPLEQEEITKRDSGILIVKDTSEKPMEGKIVGIGNGRITDDGKVVPMELRLGHIVFYGKYSGTEIKIKEKNYLWMKEEDILGIVKPSIKK